MVVGRINGVVALTGFSYEEMYGRFAGTKKSGRNNEVVVRRGSTVLTSVKQSVALDSHFVLKAFIGWAY